MQITGVKILKKEIKLTCMTPECTNQADYRVTIIENGMQLNVIVCHKCYVEGRSLDFLYPDGTQQHLRPSLRF